MKTPIALAAVMMVTLTFGMAYADDVLPTMTGPGSESAPAYKDNTDWSAKDQAAADQFASYSGDEIPVLGLNKDTGTVLYHEAFEVHDILLADRARKGSAAGGMAKKDDESRIWNRLTE